MTRALFFFLVVIVSAPAFAWRQSSTCIRIDEVDPLAPTAAARCSGTEQPFPFSWNQLEVSYQISETGSDDFADLETFIAEIDASFGQWSSESCSEFTFKFGGTAADLRHQVDEINWVGVVETDWPHSSGAIAITTVTTQRDGTIVDADMELNGAENTFAVVDETTMGDVYDVRNVVTHEAGHMLGLDHSVVFDSTMQFSSPPRQLKKRSLEDDDIEGLCTIYPMGFEPVMEPDPPSGNGCCATTSPQWPRQTQMILILLCVFLAQRVRRR